MLGWLYRRPAKAICATAAVALTTGMMGGCPLLDILFPTPDDTTTLFDTSAVVKWNEVMLSAVRNGVVRPTVVARSTFIVHNAIYDAWAQYDSVANGVITRDLRRPESEHTDANKQKAISFAAYRALLDQFPAHETNTGAYTRLLMDLGYDPDDADSTDTSTPEGIGNTCAQAILDFRQDDGSNETNNYPTTSTNDTFPTAYAPVNSADPTAANAPCGASFDTNRWQPLRVPNGTLVDSSGTPIVDDADPTTFSDQRFLTPHWGGVIPFALESYNDFDMEGPPLAGSTDSFTDALGRTDTNDAIYNLQIDEVLEFSAELNDEQKVIAEFWADGPRSESPPGHWQALGHGISIRDQHSIDDDVKFYFAITGGVFDSSIAVWGYKRQFDSIRPVSAIRHKFCGQMIDAWGGPDQGTQSIAGEEWRPYQELTFVTPPFAEYPSGHSCFSASSAEVFSLFTGSDTFFDGETVLYDEDFNDDGVLDLLGQHIVGVGGNRFESTPTEVITLQWATFKDAADEAGISRLYGGIHMVEGDLDSRELGQMIGANAFMVAEEYWNGER